MWFSLLRWFGRVVLSQKNVGKPTKAAVNVPAKNLEQELPNYKWDQQFAGTKYGGATIGARFLEKTIHEASGNSQILLEFLLS